MPIKKAIADGVNTFIMFIIIKSLNHKITKTKTIVFTLFLFDIIFVSDIIYVDLIKRCFVARDFLFNILQKFE